MSDPGTLILNVDDTEAVRYAKTRTLRRGGFAVAEAATGAEALELIASARPHLVLLDVKLPDISGLEVCRIIKQRWPEVMVLQISASFVAGEDRARGLEGGADSYITHPIEPAELTATVRALLRIRSAEDALRRMNEVLETRVAERTQALSEANEHLRREIEERKRAEAALLQSQKMEAVGQLTGGIAHDFNNLLTAVVGNLDLLRGRLTEPRALRLAERAFEAAQRGTRLTSQLLAFSRTQHLTPQPIKVNGLIEGVGALLQQSVGPAVAMRLHLDPGSGCVLVDANQLELAVLNLAINARDAMTEGGTLTVATSPRSVAPGAPPGGPEPGDYVAVQVSDTGAGMAPDVLARAFDPFFTTKPPGKGTGLGLSQVWGIARQSGGVAEIDSRPGEGTTVTLLLPACDEAMVATVPGATEERALGHQELVLVVDDDPDVRHFVRDTLLDLGYRVATAQSATEALDVAPGLAPDLLVLDYAMPDMTGAELAQALRPRFPDTPILLMSGFADTAALDQIVPGLPRLHKPFRTTELASAVRAVLRRGGAAMS